GERILSLLGVPDEGGVVLLAILGNDREHRVAAVRSERIRGGYRALTTECPQAHLFEREIAENFGLVPEGHPWLKPVRSVAARDGGATAFFEVRGDEVHEVGVGPVHAGVIEPGHFRFQCHGERVLHLEIALGYQHRGIERALAGGPDARTVHYMETLAGDTSSGHAWPHARIIEALSGAAAPPRAAALRGVALELERVANHVGDLGALAGDIGYLPTAAFCGRLRGDYLNLTAELCGSRFGRGMVRPGGVGFDVSATRADAMRSKLERALHDSRTAIELLWDTA